MLEIKPIQSKSEQEAICALCGVTFDAECMAYAAREGDTILGVAQFTIERGEGFVKDIKTKEGLDDFEALFLMGRAVLNFIDLCGVHTAVCAEDAATPRAIAAIGFARDDNGVLRADMTRMFGGCDGKH